jgi:hypothetical protein
MANTCDIDFLQHSLFYGNHSFDYLFPTSTSQLFNRPANAIFTYLIQPPQETQIVSNQIHN